MTLTVPLHNPQPQGRPPSFSQAWQVVLLLLALWVWGLLAGSSVGMGIHTDISGSPLAATNAAGNVVWKENYSAYGERQLGTTTAANQSQWFHGKEVDASTGLQYFGARYYDPAVGRFMGIDPVGFQEDNLHSFNRYAYGNNNPVRYLDPDGAYADLAIEALSLAVGLDSLRRNFSSGNYGAAAVDALGVAGDAVLTAIPVAPGAIGLGIKASREVGEVAAKETVGGLRAAGKKDAHHVIQDAAVRDLPGYNTNAAPGIQLPGPSNVAGTPHNIATGIQRQAGGGTYAAERRIGYKAMRRANVSEGDARSAIRQADNYFEGIGVRPDTVTRVPGNR